LLDVLRKRIDHSAFVVTLVCPKEPVANECVYLTAIEFRRSNSESQRAVVPGSDAFAQLNLP
jgi:hypothetical protein